MSRGRGISTRSARTMRPGRALITTTRPASAIGSVRAGVTGVGHLEQEVVERRVVAARVVGEADRLLARHRELGERAAGAADRDLIVLERRQHRGEAADPDELEILLRRQPDPLAV